MQIGAGKGKQLPGSEQATGVSQYLSLPVCLPLLFNLSGSDAAVNTFNPGEVLGKTPDCPGVALLGTSRLGTRFATHLSVASNA